MTLDRTNVRGYFAEHVRLWPFTTMFVFSLLKACSEHHVAILCEGSTLMPTFAEALCVFYCEAAGIMRQQGKPCVAYGSEVGRLDGWQAQLSRDLCRDVFFIVRTEESLQNLRALGLHGRLGTDTAWTFHSKDGEVWAREHLMKAGWDGKQPLVGVAPLDPFCWPVSPSLWRWLKSAVTGDVSLQYDKMYFFSDSEGRRRRYQHYLAAMASATNRYCNEQHAFVVVLGMEKLDVKACEQLGQMLTVPHAVFTSKQCDVFQMTGLLRLLSILLTSRYHASVLSMEHGCPIVSVSIDARLNGIMKEMGLAENYLHRASDDDLEQKILDSMRRAGEHKQEIGEIVRHHLFVYKNKVNQMSQYFTEWLKNAFS